jgi:acyl-CoA oxidase
MMGSGVGSAILKEGNPLGLHFVMFIPTIMGQGTVEQQGKWLSRAYNMEIVGTYAQVNHRGFFLSIRTVKYVIK